MWVKTACQLETPQGEVIVAEDCQLKTPVGEVNVGEDSLSSVECLGEKNYLIMAERRNKKEKNFFLTI